MPRHHADKRRSEQAKPNVVAPPSQTDLQTQRADWEGMTPNKCQPDSAPKNEGEGNRTADRSYRQGIKRFLKEGRSQEAAEKAARAVDGEEGEELRRAEQLGKGKQSH